jgi:hypothetical protein
MSTAIAGVGICVDCDGYRYDLDDDGRCWACDQFWDATDPPLPSRPTDALPGSAEKVAVMVRRAAAGQAVMHPLDATEDARPNLPSQHQTQRAAERHVYPCYAGV